MRAGPDSRVAVLDEMREGELKLDVISLGAAMSACEKGEIWRGALRLLDVMIEGSCAEA